MKKKDENRQKQTLKTFRKKKLVTVEEIANLLNCSLITARRRLKEWGALNSYNKNGRYYVLTDIPKFDQNGLWIYKDIRFSKHGNLKQTLIHLIQNSDQGLDAKQILDLTSFAPHSLLAIMVKSCDVKREKINGRFIYFSTNPLLSGKQLNKRKEKEKKSPLCDAVAVSVLVMRLKHPELDVEQLARRLQNQGVRVHAREIYEYLHHHDLVKKTPDSQR